MGQTEERDLKWNPKWNSLSSAPRTGVFANWRFRELSGFPSPESVRFDAAVSRCNIEDQLKEYSLDMFDYVFRNAPDFMSGLADKYRKSLIQWFVTTHINFPENTGIYARWEEYVTAERLKDQSIADLITPF